MLTRANPLVDLNKNPASVIYGDIERYGNLTATTYGGGENNSHIPLYTPVAVPLIGSYDFAGIPYEENHYAVNIYSTSDTNKVYAKVSFNILSKPSDPAVIGWDRPSLTFVGKKFDFQVVVKGYFDGNIKIYSSKYRTINPDDYDSEDSSVDILENWNLVAELVGEKKEMSTYAFSVPISQNEIPFCLLTAKCSYADNSRVPYEVKIIHTNAQEEWTQALISDTLPDGWVANPGTINDWKIEIEGILATIITLLFAVLILPINTILKYQK